MEDKGWEAEGGREGGREGGVDIRGRRLEFTAARFGLLH